MLVGFVLVAFAAGWVGSALQGDDVGARYLALDRPAWAPPQAAFGIVWPILYLAIGIAGWRVWDATSWHSTGLDDPRRRAARTALALWVTQLVVNAVWPWVFFGIEAFGAAVVVIVILDLLVVATIAATRRVDRLAAALLVPYLAWLLYATALNLAIAVRA